MVDYFLPHHVHLCSRGDAFVFLDLRQDDYILVSGDAAVVLRSLLAAPLSEKPSTELFSALDELLAGGLLTTDRNAGRNVAVPQVSLATQPLIDPDSPPSVRPAGRDVLHFATACMSASMNLRRNRLERTIVAVKQRKAQHPPIQSGHLERTRELSFIFQSLRSFLPRDYVCLFDSLALIEFLSRYRLFPSWVFGVKLEPWAAHCWVQAGEYVFNESVEEAASYTPVMVV